MKKILFALATLSIGFTACQKDYKSNPDEVETPNVRRGTFECLVNGDKFVGEVQSSIRNTESGANTLTIYGIQYFDTRRAADYRSISFTINNYDGTREYVFPTEVAGSYTYNYTDVPSSLYAIGFADENAKLNLTQYDETVKGTFSFKVVNNANIYDTMNITEGSFEFPVN